MCISTMAKSGMFGLAGLAASRGGGGGGGSNSGGYTSDSGVSQMILPHPANSNRLARKGTVLPTTAIMAMGGK